MRRMCGHHGLFVQLVVNFPTTVTHFSSSPVCQNRDYITCGLERRREGL